jgi:hypothetical protein
VQLFSAAIVWLVGTGILLVRGVLFIEAPGPGMHFGSWMLPVVASVAVVLGVIKARFILIRYATRAVHRIETRGKACFFGFFSVRSWVFVIVMMGGGTLLRSTPLVDYWSGRVALAVLYIAVGTALAIADRTFWLGAVRFGRAPQMQDQQADAASCEPAAGAGAAGRAR